MQDWLNEQYKSTQSLKDGEKKGRGLGAFLWQQFVDEDKLNEEAQKKVNQSIATRNDVNYADLNLPSNATTYDVEGAIISNKKAEAKAKGTTDYTRQLGLAMAPINASLQSQTNQLQMQLADNRDARAQELTYMQMRDRKDDQRYNERMEMLDRKDRKAAMQQLGMGIAALAAAFAM